MARHPRRSSGFPPLLLAASAAFALSVNYLQVLPVQPKRPASSYFLWLNDHRAEIAEKLGTKSVAVVAKEAGRMWGDLNEEAKAPYAKQAQELKAAYNVEVAAFKDAGGVIQKSAKPKRIRKEKAKKDPNAPTKPANAYMRWLGDNRVRIKSELGAQGTQKEVLSAAGKEWKILDESEKQRYKDAYYRDMAKYKELISKLPEEPSASRI